MELLKDCLPMPEYKSTHAQIQVHPCPNTSLPMPKYKSTNARIQAGFDHNTVSGQAPAITFIISATCV